MITIWEQVRSIPHGLQSITDWLGEGGHVVGRWEAQRRADICNQCELNNRGFALSGPVAAAVKRHLEVKNHIGLRVLGEKSLGVCEACKCQLKLLVHEPIERVKGQMTDDEREQLPNHCWKLK